VVRRQDRYVPLSMVVDVDEPWVPPHWYVLTGPKDWRPPLSRIIFHETVHYWQYIGHAHLVHLVVEDWARLQHFAATGECLPPGRLRRAFGHPAEGVEFSTQDLTEAHARFWDVQALGPPMLIEAELASPNRDISRTLTHARYEQLKAEGKIWREIDERGEGRGYSALSFDLAMRLAAGNYAKPYLRLRDETDDKTAISLFPLCAHFALHAESPPEFYLALVERLAPRVRAMGHQWTEFEQSWRELYPYVLREAEVLHTDRHGREFCTGEAAIQQSPLFAEHPGYYLAGSFLELARRHLERTRPPDFVAGLAGMPVGVRAHWTLDYLLGCCGMTDSRQPDLLAFLAPPVVRFADGKRWVLGALLDQLSDAGVPLPTAAVPPPRYPIAAALLDVDEKWYDLLLKVAGV
jgi:hypothetical protein